MLSAFKERLLLLKLSTINTYHQDTAYFWGNITEILSTLVYTATYLIFLTVIYQNVTTVAGYTRDQMLFFSLIGNIAFYVLFLGSFDNLDKLREDVNRGNLDVLLTKPLPLLFYLSTRRISFLMIIRQLVIPSVATALLIHWPNLHITTWNVIAGVLVFILGTLAFHVVQFFLMLPAFWFGESTDLFELSYSLSDYDMPYEAMPRLLRGSLITILPIVICAGLSVSVFLGKANANLMLLLSFVVAMTALLLKQWGWQWAMRNYTSASS